MAAESTEPIERWTAKRRVALVVSILKGETSVAEAARDAWAHGGRGRRLAGEVSAGGRERAAHSPEGRRGAQGRADQEAQTEDRRVSSSTTIILREALKPYPLDRKTSDA